MSTRTKKSTDNTRKLNRIALCLKITAALIILLAVFPGAQRTASTQKQSNEPDGKEEMQIELLDGHEVVAGEAIVRFEAADQLRRQTFVDNAVSLVGASEHREIGPAGLNMFHMR